MSLCKQGIFCCKTKLRLRVSDRQEKHYFAQPCFYFQGIFSYINERDTSSTACKHKHMLENGAPADKSGILLHIEFHDFNSRIDVLGLSQFWFIVLTHFLQTIWVPLS